MSHDGQRVDSIHRETSSAPKTFSKDAIQRTFTRQCVPMSNYSSRTLRPHGAVIGELSRRQMSSPGAGTSWVMSGQTWESCGEEPDRMVAINVRAADRDGARGGTLRDVCDESQQGRVPPSSLRLRKARNNRAQRRAERTGRFQRSHDPLHHCPKSPSPPALQVLESSSSLD